MMNPKFWIYVFFGMFPSLVYGAGEKNISDQSTTYVRASPLKVPEVPIVTEGEFIEGDIVESEGLGYGEGIGEGVGGYGEGYSDYYGEADYGYTNPLPTETVEVIETLPVQVEAPTYEVVEPVQGTTVSTVETSVASERSWSPYVSVMGGIIDPYRLSNANGKGAVGAGVGVLFGNRIAVEASFVYAYLQSSHGYCQTTNSACLSGGSVDLLTENFIDHYGLGLEGKYYFDLGSMVMPFVGAVAAYTYREHAPKSSPAVRESQAFDMGPTVGLDFRVSKRVQLGLAWRYMTNIASDINGTNNSEAIGLREVSQEAGGSLADYEKSDYQVWFANVKVLF